MPAIGRAQGPLQGVLTALGLGHDPLDGLGRKQTHNVTSFIHSVLYTQCGLWRGVAQRESGDVEQQDCKDNIFHQAAASATAIAPATSHHRLRTARR